VACDVSKYFFWRLRFCFIAFLNSPCCETPEYAIKKIEQNNRGRGGGRRKKVFFFNYRVFELPFLRNAQKRDKKIDEKILF
jgi:hypothetical protein